MDATNITLTIAHLVVGFFLVFYAAKAYKKTKYPPMLLLVAGFTVLVLGETVIDDLLSFLNNSVLIDVISEGFEIAGFIILILAVKKAEKMETNSDITTALADKYTRDILTILGKEEMSAQQIATRLEIPTSTTYRKLKTLEDLTLIRKTKIIRTVEGLDEKYYRSLVLEINVKYKDGNLTYTVDKIKMDDKIVRLWEKFKD